MVKNIAKVLMSNFFITFIGLVNSVIFPMILSIESYAQYHKFLLYLSYINICHLGIPSGMFINYAGKNYRDTPKGQYKSEMYLVIYALCIFIGIGLVTYLFNNNIMVLAITLAIFPVCIVGSYKALYQSWNEFSKYAVMNVFPNLAATILSVIIYLIVGNITGYNMMLIFILVNSMVCVYLIREFLFFTRGAKCESKFSQKNIVTLKTGFLITTGNYINVLFHAVDKQFVAMFFNNESFAHYSFAMSTQSLMSIFITSLAQPFYPFLAREHCTSDKLRFLKELLFIFGSFSGCAYYAISFIVYHFIPKYIDSLSVVAIFFAVFPAMAVINVIYINLYKITKQTIRYICTLVCILVVSILLNMAAVALHGDYKSISLATMIVYYIWLVYSQRDFEEICISFKDYLYITGFFILYFACVSKLSGISGFLIYSFAIILWDYKIYRSSIKKFKSMLWFRIKKYY